MSLQHRACLKPAEPGWNSASFPLQKTPFSQTLTAENPNLKNLTQTLNESTTIEKCDSPQNHSFQFSLFKVTPDWLWRGVAVKGAQPNVMIRYQRRAGWHATELPRPPEIISLLHSWENQMIWIKYLQDFSEQTLWFYCVALASWPCWHFLLLLFVNFSLTV